ncbi:MAG: iron ABC transporter permease [Spirochaeta sp.]|jgi:iron(III) transport system permease protein|nr:iron ABC transporter permease [Spirochaeta sp.]
MLNWIRKNGFWSTVTVLGYVMFGILILLPVFTIVRESFFGADSGRFGLENYFTFFTTPYYSRALLNSLVVSVGGTVGAVILGVPLAFFTTRYRIRGSAGLSTLATLALLTPPFLGAYAWIVMLGRNGFLRQMLMTIGVEIPTIYGPMGIIIVYTLQFYPFVFLLTAGGLQTVDRSMEEAAENLGARPFKKFFRITMPLVIPSITSGALLAFMLSLANFGTPMIIGGRYRVLPTMAYNMYTSEVATRPAMASTISIVLVLAASFAIFLQRYAANKRKYTSMLLNRPVVLKLKGVKNVFAHLVSYGIVALSTLPMVIVVIFAFRNTNGPVFAEGFGLDSFRRVIVEVPQAITNSLLFSISAVIMIVIVGTLLGFVVSRKRNPANNVLDTLLMSPYILPGTVLGIGFITTFNNPPIVLYGTATIIILAYFIRRLPYSVRSAVSILQQIDPALEEAGVSLGAPPARAFRKIALPLMLPGILSGAILSWITAINELSASILLYVGGTITMPIRIYLSVMDGYFGPGSAMATILLLATGLALLILNLVGDSRRNIV